MEKALKKRTLNSVLLIVLVFVTLCWIFSNSLDSTEISSEKSESVLEKVEPVLEKIVGEENVTVKLVRKLAHFFEFFVLGTELTLLCLLHRLDKIYAAFIGLLSALTDETIQIFSKRGSHIFDVLLDFSAVLFSILVIYIFKKIFDLIKSK